LGHYVGLTSRRRQRALTRADYLPRGHVQRLVVLGVALLGAQLVDALDAGKLVRRRQVALAFVVEVEPGQAAALREPLR